MRFAMVAGKRAPPSPGLNGTCPACESPVIARCGTERVHHWAHRSMRNCDSWWEPETEWHRSWKDKFPHDWQETIKFAANGEKHIADVCCPNGAVIEFQHSHLRPEERAARERFYGNMVWVVDGLRLSRDLPRFRSGAGDLSTGPIAGVFLTRFPEEILPSKWVHCPVPVLFDFAPHNKPVEELEPIERPLCCLLPGRVFSQAVILRLSREDFITWAQNKPVPIPTRKILEMVYQSIVVRAAQEKRASAARVHRLALVTQAPRFPHSRRYKRRFKRH